MHLQTMIRIVRDTCQEGTSKVYKEGAGSIEGGSSRLSIMAICALARAAAIFVRLCGSDLIDEDVEMLRSNLRSFGDAGPLAVSMPQDLPRSS